MSGVTLAAGVTAMDASSVAITGGTVGGIIFPIGLIGGTAAAATSNTTAIQVALTMGGVVTIPANLGDVYINSTLTINSKSSLIVNAGSTIRLAPGSNCNILRNTQWGSTQNTVTALTTPDLGITLQAASAILPAIGSYVIILGASPRVYNGSYRVLTSGAGTFTAALSTHIAPTEPITTPATGTITWMQADSDIYVEGEFDYDGANQTTPDTWQKFALYLRRLYNFRANVKVKNATKYGVALGNIYHSHIQRAIFDTFSDGIHFSESLDEVSVGIVSGKTGDDMVAVGNSDYAQYIDSAWAVGDIGSLKIDTLLPDGSLTAFKYFGCSTNVAKSITIGSIQGRISGGQGFANIICDAVAVNGSSGTLENIDIGMIHAVEPISNALANFTGGLTVQKVKFGSLVGSVNNVATARPILVGSGTTVQRMEVQNLIIDSAAYASTTFGIYNAGTITSLHINRYEATNIGRCFFADTTAGVGVTRVDRFITNNCGQAYRTVAATSQELHAGLIERNGYQSSPHIDFSNSAAGCTLFAQGSKGMEGTDAFGGSAANKTVIFGARIGIDVNSIARTQGTIVYFNSGTARGTLVNGNLVVCDNTGAAGSWKQLSNTTLNF